ncbi:hypothetical protein BV25DRAFT_1919922 [Artomyces pyxidatus]|uniref:Uncharacterized protein n=1 Tax=Artomyces pyxidatus TaxID=48021 RepID=A0ACB8SMV7_9AGAM|nr:hypothetical protein BV25DRAFT_1919922 [Artomyces pyxidatus]
MIVLYLLVQAFFSQTIGGAPLAGSATSLSPLSLTAADSTSCEDIDSCRTRYDIVWGSLVTIFACVWTAVHRNIPGPDKGRLSRMLEMMKVVVVTLLVPEWVLSWAIRQYLNARALGQELEAARSKAKTAWETQVELKPSWVRAEEVDVAADEKAGDEQVEESVPLTRRGRSSVDQARDASNGAGDDDDGGDDGRSEKSMSLAAEGDAGRLRCNWTTRHGFFIIMGGFHYYKDGKALHPLSPRDVVQLVAAGDFVPPTEEEIRVFSQGDVLSKAIAVFQTLWFILQCVARRVENLPMSQLEVMTLAYTTITVMMYGVWWYKPLNVSGPIRVAGKNLPASESKGEQEWYMDVLDVMLGMQDDYVDMRKRSATPTFYAGSFNDNNTLTGDVIALGAAMVFGAVHCAAWNYVFPSHAQSLIWRVSSTAIVAVPGSMIGSTLLAFALDDTFLNNIGTAVLWLVYGLSGPVYIAGRLLLLALSFTTLNSLPEGAYQTVEWTLRIPHFT